MWLNKHFKICEQPEIYYNVLIVLIIRNNCIYKYFHFITFVTSA